MNLKLSNTDLKRLRRALDLSDPWQGIPGDAPSVPMSKTEEPIKPVQKNSPSSFFTKEYLRKKFKEKKKNIEGVSTNHNKLK